MARQPDNSLAFLDGLCGLAALCLVSSRTAAGALLFAQSRTIGPDASRAVFVAQIFSVLLAWWMGRSRGGALLAHFGWAAAGSLVCLLIARPAHFFVENPFTSRRKEVSA